jgi:hypothetical protein
MFFRKIYFHVHISCFSKSKEMCGCLTGPWLILLWNKLNHTKKVLGEPRCSIALQ